MNAIMGTFMFFAFIAFILAHALEANAKIRAFLRAWQEGRRPPPSVDVTLNQMYGDVRIEQTEGANFRKARHARIESQPGGKR